MSQLYDTARDMFLKGQIDWSSGGADTFAAALIDTTVYNAPDFVNATDFDTEVGAAVIGSVGNLKPTLTNITTDGAGTAMADSVTFVNVPLPGSNAPVGAVIIFRVDGGTGDTATGQPIAFIDQGVNLHVLPNGGDITVVWNNGGGEIFKL